MIVESDLDRRTLLSDDDAAQMFGSLYASAKGNYRVITPEGRRPEIGMERIFELTNIDAVMECLGDGGRKGIRGSDRNAGGTYSSQGLYELFEAAGLLKCQSGGWVKGPP